MYVYFSTWTYMLYHSNIQQPHLSVQVEKWKMSSMSNLILCWFLSRCCQPSVHIGRASSMPCSKIFSHSARHLSPNSLAALRSFGSWHRRSGKKLLPSNARKDASIQQDEVGHLLRSLQNVGHLNMVEIHFEYGMLLKSYNWSKCSVESPTHSSACA